MLVSLIYMCVCVCVHVHVHLRACMCACVHMCLHAIQTWISVNKDNETGKQIGPLYIVAGVEVIVIYKTNPTGLAEQRLSCMLSKQYIDQL